jgi:membrane associated rhomboid family serine protease
MDVVFKSGKAYCPHCDWPLKKSADGYECGVCKSSFASGESQLEKARLILESRALRQEAHKGNLIMVDVDQSELPPWKRWLSYFGFPVEEEAYPTQRLPYLSLLFVGACVAIALFAQDPMRLALDPVQPWRWGGLNFLSYSLVHAGLLHLLGNLFFVWPFMDNVEEELGYGRFFVLLAAASVASALLHLAFEPRSLALVGASGVCFGVMIYYTLLHPQNRFVISIPVVGVFLYKYRIRLRAWSLLVLFAIKEALGAGSQMLGATQVSHLGHIGGALAGLACFFVFSRRS